MTLFRLKISSYLLNYFGQGMAAATPCHMGSSATVCRCGRLELYWLLCSAAEYSAPSCSTAQWYTLFCESSMLCFYQARWATKEQRSQLCLGGDCLLWIGSILQAMKGKHHKFVCCLFAWQSEPAFLYSRTKSTDRMEENLQLSNHAYPLRKGAAQNT